MNSLIGKYLFDETGCVNRDMLLLYRDKKLSPTQQYAVEKHLIDCPLCSDALEGLTLITSTAVLDEVRRRVRHRTRPAKPAQPKINVWYAAASIAIIAALSWFAYNQILDSKKERMAISATVPQNPTLEIEPTIALPDSITSSESSTVATGSTNNSFQWTTAAASTPTESLTDSVITGTYSADQKDVETASATEKTNGEISEMEPVPADEDIIDNKKVAVASAPAADFKKADISNNITYIDNVKVIDYNFNNATNSNNTDNYLNSATPSKYENQASKQAEAKKEISAQRKVTYLNLLTDPIILFNKGRYDSAIGGFNEILKYNPNDTNALFYKGLSYYHLNKYKEASKLLFPISSVSGTFSEEAEFYLAKSYLGNGDTKKAKELLETIIKREGFYSKDAANELHSIK